MADQYPSIKIKFKDIEVDLIGTEIFIDSYITKLSSVFETFHKYKTTTSESSLPAIELIASKVSPKSEKTPHKLTIDDIIKEDFNFWLKNQTNDTDDIVSYVLAAYYLQIRSKDNFFTSKGVFSLLYSHGILLADAIHCETLNIKNKNIIKVGVIKKQIKYRVNEQAVQLIKEILSDMHEI